MPLTAAYFLWARQAASQVYEGPREVDLEIVGGSGGLRIGAREFVPGLVESALVLNSPGYGCAYLVITRRAALLSDWFELENKGDALRAQAAVAADGQEARVTIAMRGPLPVGMRGLGVLAIAAVPFAFLIAVVAAARLSPGELGAVLRVGACAVWAVYVVAYLWAIRVSVGAHLEITPGCLRIGSTRIGADNPRLVVALHDDVLRLGPGWLKERELRLMPMGLTEADVLAGLAHLCQSVITAAKRPSPGITRKAGYR
jgi:hypothetical protein